MREFRSRFLAPLPRFVVSAGIAAALVTPGSLAGGIYRWVDENGRVQYGDQPPAGTDAEPVAVGADKSVSGDLEERREQRERLLDVMEEERAADARADAASAKQEAERRRNCNAATEQLRKIEEARYIYEPTGDPDNPRILGDDERGAYAARTRADVARWCK